MKKVDPKIMKRYSVHNIAVMLLTLSKCSSYFIIIAYACYFQLSKHKFPSLAV